MRMLRIALVLLALVGPLAYSADTGIYAYVDAAGEIHLSNIPDDSRYQRLDLGGGSAVPELREAPARPAPPKTANERPYGDVITQVAALYRIEEALLHAVISVESGYNAKAVSKRGAGGLMQLMPQTAKRYGVTDVFDPADNIRGGARYLTDLLKLFGNDLHLALAAYNAGESAVLKYGRRIPPYRETAAYVPKVVDFYNRIRLSM